jgi:lipopolysaccharide/colanic/teichoic acid biosynthesis glycosyltransferase
MFTSFISAALLLLILRVLLTYATRALSTVLNPTTIVIGDNLIETRVSHYAAHIDVRTKRWSPRINDPEFLHQVFNLVRDFDRVVLSISEPNDRRCWAEVARRMGINAEVVEPNLEGANPIGIGDWGGCPTLIIARGPLTLSERVAKRGFDLFVTLMFAPLVLLSSVLIAALIKLESPEPVFFIQERVGRNNRRYFCYKFRTMKAEHSDTDGSRSVSRDDLRVTRVGKLLRRTSLDELPQIWNVIRGEMSLVGPRPHALGSKAAGVPFWDAVQGYWSRHSVKPGITGLAQIRGLRGSTETQEDIAQRVASDLEYINNWSLWLDIRILLRTVTVLLHRNAF